MKNLPAILVFAIFVSASFDIFFNLNIGGFNFRFCYLASFAYILIYSLQKFKTRTFGFLGWLPFFIWFLFISAFVYNTPFLTRNIGYMAWLVFNLLVCYVLYTAPRLIERDRLIRLYIRSFFVLALCGVAQFLLSSVGVHVLVTSWWRFNRFPRVNAFSYEPSYYASYLLIGFVLVYRLTFDKVYYFKRNTQHLILLAIGGAILLSTSRMGILFMVLILVWDFLKMLFRTVVTFKISKVNFLISSVFLVSIISIIAVILTNDKLRARYLSGTGIESTASHSKDIRLRQLTDVYVVFQKSPFVGYSLGGIAPAIARLRGDPCTDQKKVKEHEGLNIFLEVLAASGIIGFLFFVSWLYQLFKGNILISRRLSKMGLSAESSLNAALKSALIAELLILMLSQNILRPYLWMLIGMVNSVYFSLKPIAWPETSKPNQA